MDTKALRKRLIQTEVKALREFGYPECNEENILTDLMYASFFDAHLKEALEKGQRGDVHTVLVGLRNEIAANLRAAGDRA